VWTVVAGEPDGFSHCALPTNCAVSNSSEGKTRSSEHFVSFGTNATLLNVRFSAGYEGEADISLAWRSVAIYE